MQPTTWHTGDRVRVFAPGSALHAQLAVVERCLGDTTAAELDLTPGHLTLLDTSALRLPMLTMGTAARALLAAHHIYRAGLVKTSDNVVGRERIRRYHSGSMLLELTTRVADRDRAGAERISEGFRVRRAAELKALAAMTVQPSPFALALAEAMQQRADSTAPARRAIGDAIPAPAAPARRRWIGRCPSTATGSGDECAMQEGHDGWHRNATGDVQWQGELTRTADRGRWVGHHETCDPDSDCGSYDCPCICHPEPPEQPATPAVLNDRMRALLTKAGAVIR